MSMPPNDPRYGPPPQPRPGMPGGQLPPAPRYSQQPQYPQHPGYAPQQHQPQFQQAPPYQGYQPAPPQFTSQQFAGQQFTGQQPAQYYQGLPMAPRAELPPDPADIPVDAELKRVIALLFVNLGLSILLTVLSLILKDDLINYQLQHTPGLDEAGLDDTVRSTLEWSLWARVGGVALGSLFYLLLAFKLRQGKRWAYKRVLWIAIGGPLGMAFLSLVGYYPVWMRIETALQGVVLLGLLYAITRPAVRARFAKPRYN